MKSRLITITVCLAWCGLSADQPSGKRDAVRLEISVQAGGLINANPINTFATVPAALRTVPWYPGDCGCGTTTVPYDSVNPGRENASYDFTGTAGLVVKERVAVRGGLNYLKSYLYETLNTNNVGRIREADTFQNIYVRGYGTSLVYYAVKNTGWTKGLAPFGEVEVTVNDWLGIVAGGSSHALGYEIEHGYDRYDALQTLDAVPFVSTQIYQPYLGVHMGIKFNLNGDENPPDDSSFGVYVTVGPTFLQTLHFAPAAVGTSAKGGMDGVSVRLGVYLNHALIRIGKARS